MFSIPFKTSSGASWVPIESWLLSEGRLFIRDEINEESANEFIQKLMYLEREKPETPVKIYINSRGGEVNAGKLIYDAIKSMKFDADIICTGMAASMAAIILAGGKKGRRFILPHSEVMIHEPYVAGGFGGSADKIQRTAESILKNKRESVALLSADTGRSKEEVEKAMSFDNYMSAEEAVEFGICDRIIMDLG